MEITKEIIDKINKACPMDWQVNEQGIFKQPFGVPDNIDGYVIYMRYESGGVRGGSCWDSSNPTPYTNDDVPNFEVLDIFLKEVCPQISYLKYKEIENSILDSTDSEWEYYGNRTDFEIKYIRLDRVLEIVEN